jgi:hypothetical protein
MNRKRKSGGYPGTRPHDRIARSDENNTYNILPKPLHRFKENLGG